jgi:hypothetical protein
MLISLIKIMKKKKTKRHAYFNCPYLYTTLWIITKFFFFIELYVFYFIPGTLFSYFIFGQFIVSKLSLVNLFYLIIVVLKKILNYKRESKFGERGYFLYCFGPEFYFIYYFDFSI